MMLLTPFAMFAKAKYNMLKIRPGTRPTFPTGGLPM